MTELGHHGVGSLVRSYRLEWGSDSLLRIVAADLPPGGPIYRLGRVDLGDGVRVGVDPLEQSVPAVVEIDDSDPARVLVQGIFDWESFDVIDDILDSSGNSPAAVAELSIRERFTDVTALGRVEWVNRWSPLALRQELLDFEIATRSVLATSAPAPRRRAVRLLTGMVRQLPVLARGFQEWAPDVEPLLQAAHGVLLDARHRGYVEDALRILQVGPAAREAADLDRELRELRRTGGGVLQRAGGRSVDGDGLSLPVDWDRLPPRVVTGLVDDPVRLDLRAGTVTVSPLDDGAGRVVRRRDDLLFQVYRDGAAVPELAGTLRLVGGSYGGTFAPVTDPGDVRWTVDVAAPEATGAVKTTIAELAGAAARRWAVRAATVERLAPLLGRTRPFGDAYPDANSLWARCAVTGDEPPVTGGAGAVLPTLAEQAWLAEGRR